MNPELPAALMANVIREHVPEVAIVFTHAETVDHCIGLLRKLEILADLQSVRGQWSGAVAERLD